MGAVHVGIRHDDDLMIPEFFPVKIFITHTGAQRGDDLFDFFAGQYFVEAGLFHIHDLAAQGQNGLKSPVPSLFGAAAGRIALNQKNFPFRRNLALAFGQFAGHEQVDAGSFLARQFLGPSGCFPRPGGIHRLGENLSGLLGVFLQINGQLLVAD